MGKKLFKITGGGGGGGGGVGLPCLKEKPGVVH